MRLRSLAIAVLSALAVTAGGVTSNATASAPATTVTIADTATFLPAASRLVVTGKATCASDVRSITVAEVKASQNHLGSFAEAVDGRRLGTSFPCVEGVAAIELKLHVQLSKAHPFHAGSYARVSGRWFTMPTRKPQAQPFVEDLKVKVG